LSFAQRENRSKKPEVRRVAGYWPLAAGGDKGILAFILLSVCSRQTINLLTSVF
jgi:hypothetical protein